MYKYIVYIVGGKNAVGGKKCISLCGGYSWPDLLCWVSVDVKM